MPVTRIEWTETGVRIFDPAPQVIEDCVIRGSKSGFAIKAKVTDRRGGIEVLELTKRRGEPPVERRRQVTVQRARSN